MSMYEYTTVHSQVPLIFMLPTLEGINNSLFSKTLLVVGLFRFPSSKYPVPVIAMA